MSTFISEVVQVLDVKPHPKPEVTALELLTIQGWQVVAAKGQFKPGDLAVYFAPDTLFTDLSVAVNLGVDKYLSKGRVRLIKLQGEPSFGFAIHAPADFVLGADVSAYYKTEKYEPPATAMGSGDVERDDPNFPSYTDIEHLRRFPDIIPAGTQVVVTEKVHGFLKNDSPVFMADGIHKNIENVKIGDSVKTFDGQFFVNGDVINIRVRD